MSEAQEVKTVDIQLRPGNLIEVPLANGPPLRVRVFRRQGRPYLRIYDAATGQKVKTVRASAEAAIESLLTSQSKSQE